MTCRLVRDAPPSSSSPCGEEEERRARWRRRRGLGCKLSQYRASIRCSPAKWRPGSVWCRLECTLLLFPLPLPWCARKTTETRTPVPLSRGLDPRRGPQAPGLGRFKGMRFLREGGNRNPPSLKRLFGDFLAGQKVTRGPGPGRSRRWQVCRRFAPRARRARQNFTADPGSAVPSPPCRGEGPPGS